ncbi:MAG: L-fucose dehydrogenase [Chitinophagaceae bacterium]
MDLGLNGKVFIVTGGAKGIGRAICHGISAEGGKVILAGRNLEDNQQVVESIIQSGGVARSIDRELSVSENCREIVSFSLDEFGRLDGLVNNAGVNDGIGLQNGSPEKFVDSLQRNLIHYYNMAYFALPALKENKGAIVNISSKTAETGQGGTSGYAASKGGINALTREWAVELLPYGIRVNGIIPSEVWTPLYEKWINSFPNPEDKLKSIVSKIPFGHRMTTAVEIANMTVFLLSPLSGHTTGQLIHVDGGYVHLDRAIS